MNYRITDLTKNLFSDPIKIEAESPLLAVKKAYPNKNVKRDYSGKIGEIVVNSTHGSYVYQLFEKDDVN